MFTSTLIWEMWFHHTVDKDGKLSWDKGIAPVFRVSVWREETDGKTSASMYFFKRLEICSSDFILKLLLLFTKTKIRNHCPSFISNRDGIKNEMKYTIT